MCFGVEGYQSHEFHAFDMEGLEASLTTVHWIKNWRESRQAAYKNREISFKSWNFLEFTLAAAEGGHRGLLRPVDGKTLIPRLTGGLLALLGLLKP